MSVDAFPVLVPISAAQETSSHSCPADSVVSPFRLVARPNQKPTAVLNNRATARRRFELDEAVAHCRREKQRRLLAGVGIEPAPANRVR